MNIGLAQINTTVGDLEGNAHRILEAYHELVEQGAQLVITPELSITGYPPQDLLLISGFIEKNRERVEWLKQQVGPVPLLVGFVDDHPEALGKRFFNAAAVLQKNHPLIIAHKRLLPTYDIFDEARYFEAGKESPLLELHGKKIGITICEDLWTPDCLPQAWYQCDPLQELITAGAEIIVNLSASPFQIGKPMQREKMLCAQAKRFHIPIIYCNAIGGNDQLIFDGNSMIVAADGKIMQRFASCREEKKVIDLSLPATENANESEMALRNAELKQLHDALVLGVRDYLHKCGFRKALIGLSGGIDSALVASIAVAALGAESVAGVLMPGPYSSQGSIDDAVALAKNLKMPTLHLPITTSYEGMMQALQAPFSGYPVDITEENLQARLRGVTLMALSNKFGSMVLTTGNKSEMAVGYCTLYGDMCGGLAVIADVPKTLVYELSHWINREHEVIPRATLEKPPSAELRPNQKDQDSLPPYETLDAILQLAIEENDSIKEIVARGFAEETVRWIVTQLHRSEYKRQQAAPVLKVTGRAFGRGRRFPIAQRYVEEEKG